MADRQQPGKFIIGGRGGIVQKGLYRYFKDIKNFVIPLLKRITDEVLKSSEKSGKR